MIGTPNVVIVAENDNFPYGQDVTIGRHIFTADEPYSAGGQDSGPSPYDFLMTGLGACTAMHLRAYAYRRDWAIRKFTVEIRHESINAGGNSTIHQFNRFIYVDGDITEEQRLQLLKVAEGKGRVAAMEIMVGTPAIANLIREGKTFQIPSIIQTAKKDGMQLMDQNILDLMKMKKVTPAEAYRCAQDKKLFEPHLTEPLAAAA